MAKRFLTSLRLLNLSSDPVSASAGELYFNSSDNLVKYHDGSEWKNLGGGSEGVVVESGSSYPTTSLTNGKLFYNTTNGRTAIYFNSIWKEFAYQTDIVSTIDGGDSSTQEFDLILDGGNASTQVFENAYDGGNS